jgi:hypothetical protein
MDDALSKIYAALLAACPAATLRSPWDQLPTDARHCPSDGSALLADWRATYEPNDLLRSGVAVGDAEGQLVLGPALADPGGLLLFLRSQADGAITHVLTASGCLAPGQLPLLASLADGRTREAIPPAPAPDLSPFSDRSAVEAYVATYGKIPTMPSSDPYAWKPAEPEPERYLLLAFTFPTLLVLRALGFAVTLAAGLERIGPAELARLCPALGWCRSEKPAVQPIELVFVSWPPEAPSPNRAAQMEATRKQLWDFQEILDVRGIELSDWRPPETLGERIDYQLRFQDAQALRNTLREALEQHRYDCLEPEDPPPPPLPSLEDARSGLRKALRDLNTGRGTPDVVERAARIFDAVLDRDLIGPLVGLHPADPAAANLVAALAELSPYLHRSLVGLEAAQAPPHKLLRGETLLPPDTLRQALQLLKAVHGLTREIACHVNVRSRGLPSVGSRRSSLPRLTWKP